MKYTFGKIEKTTIEISNNTRRNLFPMLNAKYGGIVLLKSDLYSSYQMLITSKN